MARPAAKSLVKATISRTPRASLVRAMEHPPSLSASRNLSRVTASHAKVTARGRNATMRHVSHVRATTAASSNDASGRSATPAKTARNHMAASLRNNRLSNENICTVHIDDNIVLGSLFSRAQ